MALKVEGKNVEFLLQIVRNVSRFLSTIAAACMNEHNRAGVLAQDYSPLP